MFWPGVLVILCFCWVAYMFYLTAVFINRGRPAAEGAVYVLMGNQAEVAEWFLCRVYRNEGILSGRLAVVVAAEGIDDTTAIVRIFFRKKSYLPAEPGECLVSRRVDSLKSLFLDVRGLNSCKLLEEPLDSLKSFI